MLFCILGSSCTKYQYKRLGMRLPNIFTVVYPIFYTVVLSRMGRPYFSAIYLGRKMTKADLVEKVANKIKCAKKETEAIVGIIFQSYIFQDVGPRFASRTGDAWAVSRKRRN